MLGKPPAPFANGMLGMTEFLGNLFAGQTLRTFQHDTTPVRKRPFRLVLA